MNKNYWVYLRVRMKVNCENEQQAEAKGLAEVAKIAGGELRKLGVFVIEPKKAS